MNETAALLLGAVAIADFALVAHLRDRRRRTATCERMMECLWMELQRESGEDATTARHDLAPAG